jgi:serine/threonine-protein kinase
MPITDPLVLPDDVRLVPVNRLPPEVRGGLNCDEEDYAVTRPQSRSTSKIIDANSARLLERFQKPRTIAQAVIDLCREDRSDPEETLEAAFPLLQALLQAGLLVEAGSERANKIDFTLKPGDSVAGGKVLRCVQVVEDTELYQMELDGGVQAAMKMVRQQAGAGRDWALRNETTILSHLDGDPSPKLLGSGSFEGRPYIIEEWCSGVECSVAAQRLRGTPDERPKLLNLCVGILDAYARLHARGVLHVDIHPRNLLAAEDGSARVRIIDFGYSCFGMNGLAPAQIHRPGIPFFFEPEYAAAVLKGLPLAPSFSGEQYGLAALIYLLMTGAQYVDFSLEREGMLKQMAEDPPRPFAARGIPPWPEVEAVLSKALSKSPGDRYASVQEFTGVLRECAGAQMMPAAPAPGGPSPSRRLLDRVIDSLQLDAPLYESTWSDAPSCSVNSGAAGFAYALYRIACLRRDPELLSLADLWSTKARASINSSSAFYNPALDVTPKTVGRVSPYHTASGVHAVQALISLAMGDLATAEESIEHFIDAADGACENLDLTLGRSGVVLGCALLLEAAGKQKLKAADRLREFGDRTAAGIWNELNTALPMDQAKQFSFLGIAHGWAGALYTTLRWCRLAKMSVPEWVAPRLDELAGRARFEGESAKWKRPSTPGVGDAGEYWAGWCAGSAGYVHLWTLAESMLRNKQYAALARAAGLAAWDDQTTPGDLCCGYSGRAYGLLNLYKHTGEAVWLDRARELAERAAISIQQYSLRANSLYKGEVGVALLIADLERPELAAMPFFEHEGWPARN